MITEKDKYFASFIGQTDTKYDQKELLELFETSSLFKALFTVDNFHNYYEEENPFVSVVDKILNLNLDTYCAKYARLYCELYANLVSSYKTTTYIYNIDDMIDNLCKLKNDYLKHGVMIDILLSRVYALLKEHKMESITTLRLIKTEDKELKAYALYLLSEQCKGLEMFRELRYQSLETAYKLNKDYKICYNLGLEYLSLDAYDSAEKYFKKCLELVTKGEFMTPLEQEYYFNVIGKLATVYFNVNDYNRAVSYADKALDFKEDLYEKQKEESAITKVFYTLYKENPVKYIGKEIEKMNSVPLYRLLGDACTELGMTERAECYFKYLKSLD